MPFFVEYIPWTVSPILAILVAMDRQFTALQKQLGHKVKVARKALGLSQEKLALEAEIDRTYISQIERGICNPSLLALHKISKILKVPVTDLL